MLGENKVEKSSLFWYNNIMIKKVIKTLKLQNKGCDLAYWLSKSPQERIEAVEILRKQFNGTTKRFQRIIKVIQQI